MPVAMITGPSSGIGRATAFELGRRGFHIVAAGRSKDRVQPVIDAIGDRGGSAEFLELDLAALASVRLAAATFLRTGRTLDVLVNNAGIGINRRGLTEDGFEVHFGINHLAHHLLTRSLEPALGPGSRVVSLSSAVHHRAAGIDFDEVRRPTRFTGYSEYATSKLAIILFIRELSRRATALTAYAVHPGLVDTPIIPRWVRPFAPGMLTPEEGADTVVWCATATEVAEESGHYYQGRRRTTPSRQGEDDALARELWERSEGWSGLASAHPAEDN